MANISADRLFRITPSAAGWPKVFEDPLLRNPGAFLSTCNDMALAFRQQGVNKIIAKTAKGMVPGAVVADILGLPLVIAGESGKMPGMYYMMPVSNRGFFKEYIIKCSLLDPGADNIGIVDNVMHSGRAIAHIGSLLEKAAKVNVLGAATFVRYPHEEQKAWYEDWLKAHYISSPFRMTEHGGIEGEVTTGEEPVMPEYSSVSIDRLKEEVCIHPNYPHGPVMWTNYDGILANPSAYKTVVDHLSEQFMMQKIDVVLALGVRGFHWGPMIANRLSAELVLAQKPHKFEENVGIDKISYSLEYNPNAAMAIPKGTFKPGDRVLIVDDTLATGGTGLAAWELAMMQKAEIVGIACMIGLLDVMEDSDAYHALSDICSISTMLNFTNTELRSKYEADKALGNIFTNH